MPQGPSGSGLRSPASKKHIGSPYFTRQYSIHALFSRSAYYSERYQRCSQFEDMINKQNELKAAVTSSRSGSVRVAYAQIHINSIDHAIPASRFSPRARVQAIANSSVASLQIFFTPRITVDTQWIAEAPLCSL